MRKLVSIYEDNGIFNVFYEILKSEEWIKIPKNEAESNGDPSEARLHKLRKFVFDKYSDGWIMEAHTDYGLIEAFKNDANLVRKSEGYFYVDKIDFVKFTLRIPPSLPTKEDIAKLIV